NFVTSTKSRRLDLKQPLRLTFNKPLQSIDSNAIRLEEDSTHRKVDFQLSEREAGKEILLRYDWKEDTPYRVLLDSAFAADTFGIAYVKNDTLTFTAKKNAARKSKSKKTDEKEKEEKKLTFSTSLKSQQQDLKQPLKITFNEPLKTIDSNAIRLQEDTLHRNVTYSWEKDTSGKGILLHYDWKEDTRYRLLLDSAFAVDTSG